MSSAIDVAVPAVANDRERIVQRLRPFADTTYLHQVIERRNGALTHFPDLDDALSSAPNAADHAGGREWRIHFHVPLFTQNYDGLSSTQDYVRRVIDAAARARFTAHLEIETYTWDVLPDALKFDLLESIHREYRVGAVHVSKRFFFRIADSCTEPSRSASLGSRRSCSVRQCRS